MARFLLAIDEEFVILVTYEPKKDKGFSFPYEPNPEFDFDENAESERLAKLQNTWLKDLLSRFSYSAWFVQIFWSTTVENCSHLRLLCVIKLEP